VRAVTTTGRRRPVRSLKKDQKSLITEQMIKKGIANASVPIVIRFDDDLLEPEL
jgi:hypothetical protein